MMATILALTGFLAGSTEPWRVPSVHPSRPFPPLLIVALLGAGPWVAYAVAMSAHGRQDVPYLTDGIDHWPAQAAFALSLVALPSAAAAGWGAPQLAGWTTGVAGGGFGAFAMLYPSVDASLGSAWGFAALIWGVAVLVATQTGRTLVGTAPERQLLTGRPREGEKRQDHDVLKPLDDGPLRDAATLITAERTTSADVAADHDLARGPDRTANNER